MESKKIMPVVDETVYVLDKKNKGPYKCTVLEVDGSQETVHIHWVGCGKKHDEWVTIDRLVDIPAPMSADPNIVDAIADISKIDATVDKFMQVFSHSKSDGENEKILYKTFPVNTIELCAESLHIEISDNKGKNFKKMDLIKKILSKIKSLLPMHCRECQGTYKLAIDEEPLVTCFLCEKPSHNCAAYESIKTNLPSLKRLGFRYVCAECDSSPSLQQAAALPESDLGEESRKSVDQKDNNTHTVLSSAAPSPKSIPKPIPICQRYRRGQCPHGVKGKKLVEGERCAYAHPRKCHKFLSAGNDKRYGCGHGKKCKFLHPVLCPSSGKGDGVCSRKSCKLVHLKRARPSDVSPESRSSHSRVGGNTNRKAATTATASTPSKNDQLERIEQMILSMQTKYDKELKALRQQLSLAQSPSMSWMVPNYPWMTPPFGSPTPLTSFHQQVPTSYSH